MSLRFDYSIIKKQLTEKELDYLIDELNCTEISDRIKKKVADEGNLINPLSTGEIPEFGRRRKLIYTMLKFTKQDDKILIEKAY